MSNWKSKVWTKYPNLTIGNALSKGSQGEVFSGTLDNNPVAVKMERNKQPVYESVSVFYKKLMTLDSPHISKIFSVDTFKIGNYYYMVLVMERIDGFDLYKFDQVFSHYSNMPQDKLKLELALSILEGLKFLSDNQLYHRDIKPDNIMIRKDSPQAVFIDFSLSCDFANFDASGCQNRGGAMFTKPYLYKSYVNDKFTYVSSIDSDRLKCRSKYTKDPVDSDELKQMFENVDTWGVIHTLVYLEVYKTSFAQMSDDIGAKKLYTVFEYPGECEFFSNTQNTTVAPQAYNVFFNTRSNLFYPVFQDYLRGEDVSTMVETVKALYNSKFPTVAKPKIPSPVAKPPKTPSPVAKPKIPSPVAKPPKTPSPVAKPPSPKPKTPSPKKKSKAKSPKKSKTCSSWKKSPGVNPKTKRKISSTGKVYKDLEKKCGKVKEDKKTLKSICQKWFDDRGVNPETKRKISPKGQVYKKLSKKCEKY